MCNRIFITLVLLIGCIGSPALAVWGAAAQTPQAPKAATKAKPAKPESAPGAASTPYGAQIDAEPVSVKLARGGKVAISSRSGRVIVSGWDKDVVEAKATGDHGPEPVEAQTTGDSSRPRLLLTVSRRIARDVKLDVRVPRYADVEVLEGYRGDVDISNVEGAALINTGSGDVRVTHVGSLKVTRRKGDITAREVKGDLTARSFSGEVVVESVGGLADVAATNGDLRVHNAGGDVRANSATGDIEIRCAKGRAEASSASGSITLIGVSGDVEASTASGEAIFKGPIKSGGNYRLKSLSGEVSMTIQPDPPGFTATLTTYNGDLQTDFPLKVEAPLQGPVNRRITGRFGDGQTKIALDSFSGTVKIAKGAAAALKECK